LDSRYFQIYFATFDKIVLSLALFVIQKVEKVVN